MAFFFCFLELNFPNQISNILESTDIINEYLMEGDTVDIIYLDFSKAFHMVSHYHILLKMKKTKNSKYCKIFFDRKLKVTIGLKHRIYSLVLLRDQY